jgi:glyoxylase-like metal-dependent hydrolase (beta-lactamase superfamily II)
MLYIKIIPCNMMQENTYIVNDDTHQAVIIDCGAYFPKEREAVATYIRVNDLQVVRLLCTHGHFDHCCGNDTIYDNFHLQPELHADDMFLAADMAEQARNLLGMDYDRPTPPVGHFLTDGEVITFGDHRLVALHTPGHTPGSLIFNCPEERAVFTGDTLFRLSIGRTDFERGSWEDMNNSLRNVVTKLPAETVVYPGHGPKTTIRVELRTNPYLK